MSKLTNAILSICLLTVAYLSANSFWGYMQQELRVYTEQGVCIQREVHNGTPRNMITPTVTARGTGSCTVQYIE